MEDKSVMKEALTKKKRIEIIGNLVKQYPSVYNNPDNPEKLSFVDGWWINIPIDKRNDMYHTIKGLIEKLAESQAELEFQKHYSE